jgi:ABC-type xylose transport system permease subunit
MMDTIAKIIGWVMILSGLAAVVWLFLELSWTELIVTILLALLAGRIGWVKGQMMAYSKVQGLIKEKYGSDN